jgi:hypothetical protein
LKERKRREGNKRGGRTMVNERMRSKEAMVGKVR